MRVKIYMLLSLVASGVLLTGSLGYAWHARLKSNTPDRQEGIAALVQPADSVYYPFSLSDGRYYRHKYGFGHRRHHSGHHYYKRYDPQHEYYSHRDYYDRHRRLDKYRRSPYRGLYYMSPYSRRYPYRGPYYRHPYAW